MLRLSERSTGKCDIKTPTSGTCKTRERITEARDSFIDALGVFLVWNRQSLRHAIVAYRTSSMHVCAMYTHPSEYTPVVVYAVTLRLNMHTYTAYEISWYARLACKPIYLAIFAINGNRHSPDPPLYLPRDTRYSGTVQHSGRHRL